MGQSGERSEKSGWSDSCCEGDNLATIFYATLDNGTVVRMLDTSLFNHHHDNHVFSVKNVFTWKSLIHFGFRLYQLLEDIL